MSFIGTVCGKIQTRKIKNGFSHNLMLVRNFRCPMTGKPRFAVIFNFGTVRSYHVKDRAASMWKKIDFVLDNLAAKGNIMRQDAERAKAKFAELLGEPTPTAPVPVPAAKLKSTPSAERQRKGFPDWL